MLEHWPSPSLPVWQAHPDGQWKKALCDGLHFNGQGNKFLYDEIVQLIKTSAALQRMHGPL